MDRVDQDHRPAHERDQRRPALARAGITDHVIDASDGMADAELPTTDSGIPIKKTYDADDLAGWCGTIPYEIVARIAEWIPRIRV